MVNVQRSFKGAFFHSVSHSKGVEVTERAIKEKINDGTSAKSRKIEPRLRIFFFFNTFFTFSAAEGWVP